MKVILLAATAPLALGACASIDTPAIAQAPNTAIAVANPAVGIRLQNPAGFPDFESRQPSEPGLWPSTNGTQAPMHGGSN